MSFLAFKQVIMKRIITVQNIHKPLEVEVFDNLSTTCDRMGWSYEYVRKFKKYPFQHKDYWVDRKVIKRNV